LFVLGSERDDALPHPPGRSVDGNFHRVDPP
jgi:hypothetical protein